MPQLTGTLTGTPQSDLFAGEIQIVDITSNTSESGIFKATINDLNGLDGTGDSYRGVVSLTASAAANLTSRGIDASTIRDDGLDDDSVTATATSIGFQNQGRATSYGVFGGSINTGGEIDSFLISGTSRSALRMKGVGVGFATIDGGDRRDDIRITGSAIGGGAAGSSAVAFGTEGAVIKGGGEAVSKDTITIAAEAQNGSNDGEARANAIGVKGGWVLGEGDDDTIAVTAEASGTRGIARGASKANVWGGAGGDRVNLLATATGSARSGARSVAAGIDNQTVVFGGDGADVMGISGNASSSGRSGAAARAYGVRSSSFFGGDGNDAMFISATAEAERNARAYGVFKSTDVSAGEGDDFVVVTATTTAQGSTAAYGLYESKLFTGNGNDRIIVQGVTNTASGRGGYGAFKSEINAGAGNDSIKVEATARAAFDIQDAVIFGGDGDDTLDVGIGSGQLNGQGGTDVAILDYFNADTMTVTAFDGGVVRIAGTQTKSGANKAWQQDIFNVESFQVGDALYSAETLASTFGV